MLAGLARTTTGADPLIGLEAVLVSRAQRHFPLRDRDGPPPGRGRCALPQIGFATLHATPLAQDSGSACVTDFDTRRLPDEVRASIVVGRSTADPVSSTLDPVVLALCGLALAALTPLAMTAIFAPLAARRCRRLGG